MLWAREDVKVEPANAKKYTIRPQSALDIPKTILLNPRDFEVALHDHFAKSTNDSEQILIELYKIYRLYKDHGAVLIQSTHGKLLRNRHEHVVMEVVKANVEHLMQLNTYLKAS